MSRFLKISLRGFILATFLISLLCQPGAIAQAASGQLIPGFGSGGIVTTNPTPNSDSITSVVILPDGKIIAGGVSMTGDFVSMSTTLARYTSSGSLDTSFGNNGIASVSFGPGWTDLMDIDVQADGKIVAAGMYATIAGASRVFAVARFCPDGSLDTGTNCSTLQPKFGTNGTVSTQLQLDNGKDQSYAQAVVVQSDQKIVAGGLVGGSGQRHQFALACYNPDGSLDTTFNTTGMVIAAPGNTQDEIYDLKMDANQKIVAAGFSSDDSYNTRFGVARFNANGSLDTSLNGSGMLTTVVGETSMAYSLAVQPGDGKLVVAGYTSNSDIGAQAFAVVRYNANGNLDASFGVGGQQYIYFDPAVMYDTGQAVAVDSLGRIVVGGSSLTSDYTTEVPALARLCPNGKLDNGSNCGTVGFGTGGLVTVPIGAGSGAFRAVAIRPSDGNILAAGRSTDTDQNVFSLALVDGGMPADHSISGNAGSAGAILSYTDKTPKTAIADQDGGYSFTVSDDWSGTVTPEKAGFTFNPTHYDYAHVTQDQQDQNYTATAITYTISGKAGIAGATLSYTDNGAKTATADDNGNYTLTVPYSWSGSVTPSLTGYSFTPPSNTYIHVLGSKTGENYTATPITYTISGKAGIAGATLSYIDHGAKTATADDNGDYTLTVSYSWSGTVTPSKLGYIFNPASNDYTNILASRSGEDYSAAFTAPVTSAATGVGFNQFTANWSAVPGATGYVIDVATDDTFTHYVSGYQFQDAGNVTNLTISGLAAHTTYYYRVRAYNTVSQSGVSNRMTVLTNQVFYLPMAKK